MPAPKGNTNALKHGLYAKQFNEDQRSGLKKMAWDDFRHEEFAARVVASDVFRLLQNALSMPVCDVDQVSKLAQAFVAAITATGTSARTHANLNGKDEPLGDALSEALGNVPFFEDDRVD